MGRKRERRKMGNASALARLKLKLLRGTPEAKYMGYFSWAIVALAVLGVWVGPTTIGLIRRWYVGVSVMRKIRLLMSAGSTDKMCAARWVFEDGLRCAQAFMVVSFLEKVDLGSDIIGNFLFQCSMEAVVHKPDKFGEVLGDTLRKLTADAEARLDAANVNQAWTTLKTEAETLALHLTAIDAGRNLAA